MGYAIRDEQYRYVEWKTVGRHVDPGADYSDVADKQLFDYSKDPLETINVVGKSEYSDAEARLMEALHECLRTTVPSGHGNQ